MKIESNEYIEKLIYERSKRGRPTGYRKDKKIALSRVINFTVKKRQYDAIKEFNTISFDKFSKLVRAEIIKIW